METSQPAAQPQDMREASTVSLKLMASQREEPLVFISSEHQHLRYLAGVGLRIVFYNRG